MALTSVAISTALAFVHASEGPQLHYPHNRTALWFSAVNLRCICCGAGGLGSCSDGKAKGLTEVQTMFREVPFSQL